ncbi:TPA: helix-turn-helix transcriptional regulator [Pseudomonas aeruginosa]|uniref:S24 family peptidase n=1 Tax=Pseudomonas aeruginosa TaxID=287 RepID=UPI002B40606C|nr:helix-turn-helix transcriptional regulator [Pseudomonas aeruginosa]HBP5544003.1 helix-turn-helix transcriptional regulator [Pseudomonas aeruginosa]HBP6576149.1 helix-turn-helix transcriptional regulator [Pseudomonas aeruginosa]
MIDISTIRRTNALSLAEQEGGTGAFASRIDREPTQVSRLIGSNPTKNIGNKLARHIEECFDLPRGWLDVLHGKHIFEAPHFQAKAVSPLPSADADAERDLMPLSTWEEGDPLDLDEVEIPYFDEIQVAAGGGRFPDLELAKRKIRFPRSVLHESGVNPKYAVCVNVTGNSMDPLIADGAVIGIDMSVNAITDGEIYALKHDDLLRVKFVYRLPGGGIRLRSYNRDEYPDEEYTKDQMREGGISVIGWVFWWSVMRRRKH